MTYTILMPCDCCSGDHICDDLPCSCCEGDTAAFQYTLTLDPPLQFTLPGGGAHDCDGTNDQQDYSPWPGGPVNLSGDCVWIDAISVGCNVTEYLRCIDGVWYYIFDVVYLGDHILKLQLNDFTCCSFSQSTSLTPVDVDAIYTVVPTSVTITSNGYPCCTVTLGCCPDNPLPVRFDVLTSSPIAGVDDISFPIIFDGVNTWSGTVETGCVTCHTLTFSISCISGVWSYSAVLSGTSVNPSPPPPTLSCVAPTGILGCTDGITFDCSSASGVATWCLAAVGDTISGSSCGVAGFTPTTFTIARPTPP